MYLENPTWPSNEHYDSEHVDTSSTHYEENDYNLDLN